MSVTTPGGPTFIKNVQNGRIREARLFITRRGSSDVPLRIVSSPRATDAGILSERKIARAVQQIMPELDSREAGRIAGLTAKLVAQWLAGWRGRGTPLGFGSGWMIHDSHEIAFIIRTPQDTTTKF